MRPIGQINADFVFTYFHQEERVELSWVASLMLVMESFLSFEMHPESFMLYNKKSCLLYNWNTKLKWSRLTCEEFKDPTFLKFSSTNSTYIANYGRSALLWNFWIGVWNNFHISTSQAAGWAGRSWINATSREFIHPPTAKHRSPHCPNSWTAQKPNSSH